MNRSTSQLSSNKRMQRTRVMDKLVLRLRHRRVAEARRSAATQGYRVTI
jgi:hypothetical protein